jgi:major membrane immunogen (membrane-anchored lipoprotein)
MDFMLDWHSSLGIRPGNFVIYYQNSLVSLQNPDNVQPISGSRNMHIIFTFLAQHAIDQARKGENAVAFVELPQGQYPNEL